MQYGHFSICGSVTNLKTTEETFAFCNNVCTVFTYIIYRRCICKLLSKMGKLAMYEKGKLAMYESMKKSVIRVFDDGLVSATNTP